VMRMLRAFSQIFLVRQGIVLILAMSCVPGLPQTRQPQARGDVPLAAGDYRIAGMVVNAVTGEPLRHATVAALTEADSHTVASVESDNEGRFALEQLPAAKYQLTASKRGFRTAFYDEHEDFNSAIVTGPGQDTERLTFGLVPGAVLRGVITGDGGDPVENARVMLFRKPNTHKLGDRITQVDSAITDDTGAYEIGNLAPGEYLVAVTGEPWYAVRRNGGNRPGDETTAALDVAYPVTFFDSTTDEESATAMVLTGGSREEANINVHAVPALRLVVETPRKQDGSIARPELRQTVFGSVISAESSGFVLPNQSGSTEFTGIAPGRYELAQGDPPRVMDLDATASEKVDPGQGTPTTAVSGVLRAATGSIMSGETTVLLEWVDGGHHEQTAQTTATNGRFSFSSVPPGTWQLWADRGGRQLAIESITTGNKTHSGGSVTVREKALSLAVNISDGATRVEGFARRDGKGVAGVMVVLVPKDLTAMHALVRRDQSDSDGSFGLRDVVPGEYTVVAIEDGWKLDWAQAAVISRYLPKGIAVTVNDRPGKALSLSTAVQVQDR